ncbi:hypothetical protein OPV22_016871 [Ensete ventricosum]|uniref:Cyclin N-terminal domain-containing protein n=1 Tax=Ensete ventricosum TaxID=4639 RepID=A0AAV8PH93_ENSVE|nr:hypothetical protein OPV22_016871 [Ensete ventricosum]
MQALVTRRRPSLPLPPPFSPFFRPFLGHLNCSSSSHSPPWYSPPPQTPQADPLLLTISHAVLDAATTSLDASLKPLLPSLNPSLFVSLLTLNPLSLPPSSLLDLFHWLSARPNFRHTPVSYLAMAAFLLRHRLLSAALPPPPPSRRPPRPPLGSRPLLRCPAGRHPRPAPVLPRRRPCRRVRPRWPRL